MCIRQAKREGLCDFQSLRGIGGGLGGVGLDGPGGPGAKPSVEKWKPPSTIPGPSTRSRFPTFSNPAIKGVYAGFAIRDALWKATNGQIYFENLPFSMLAARWRCSISCDGRHPGHERVLGGQHQPGPRMGLVNLPFLVNTYEKLEKFVGNKKLFQYFLDGMSTRGSWAWTSPPRPVRLATTTR